jgi:MFS transporter, ACS family, tartrate transporter
MLDLKANQWWQDFALCMMVGNDSSDSPLGNGSSRRQEHQAAVEYSTLRALNLQLLPLLFLGYLLACLDRANVGFAALQMNRDLGFGPAVYGFGAGIFFVGYSLCEVPSNFILVRVGARRWFARILITWGILATSMLFVRTPLAFYVLRFSLGVAEGGFFPGVLWYIGNWYPASHRARAIALFSTGTPVAQAIGGALAGSLLQLNGRLGLAGWQWLFLIEGFPAGVLGVLVFCYLHEHPNEAPWLGSEQREWLIGRLARDQSHENRENASFGSALRQPVVWRLGATLFLATTVGYAQVLWLPQILKGFGTLSDMGVGMAISAMGVFAAVVLYANGTHSDRFRERYMHAAIPLLITCGGWLLLGRVQGLITGILALAALACRKSMEPPFWAISRSFLNGEAAAGGFALINSMATFGGFVGPTLIGLLLKATGGYHTAFLALSAMDASVAVLVFSLRYASALSATSTVPASQLR